MKVSFNQSKLNELLAAFYQRMKITITCFDRELNCVAYAGGWENYCLKISEKRELWGKCYNCDCDSANIASKSKNTYIYTCHAGIAEAVTPLFLEEEPIGYLSIGKFRDAEEKISSEEEVGKVAEKYGLNKETMLNAYRELPVLDEKSINATIIILKAFVYYICSGDCIRINREDEMTASIDKYINEHWGEKLTVAMLSNHLGIGKYALTDFFKKNFDETPQDYLEKKRLQYAKTLLTTTNDGLIDITEKVGFSTFSYFSQWFKKNMGVSPSRFRKENGDNNTL